MKYIKQLAIILAVSFIGEILNRVIPLPIPAGVYGVVILFLLLWVKIVPLSAVEDTASFLIDIMPLMFIPAAVGLVESFAGAKSSIVAYLVISLVTTVVVMGVSGIVTELLIRRRRRTGK